MNVKIDDLMSTQVIVAEPHHSVEHVRKMLDRNGISTVPVVDSDQHPVGIIALADLPADAPAGSPIKGYMTDRVYSVPQYDDASMAARIMRNHKIHHVVVTHEQKIVGMISSFDLLKLIEGHRYVAKNAPTKSKRKGSKRA